MNDAYDSIPTYKPDDRLVLLYSASRSNNVAVRTACGLTGRFNIPNIVQQGGTWGPVLSSNSIDVIGKKIWSRGKYCYLYRDKVRI